MITVSVPNRVCVNSPGTELVILAPTRPGPADAAARLRHGPAHAAAQAAAANAARISATTASGRWVRSNQVNR